MDHQQATTDDSATPRRLSYTRSLEVPGRYLNNLIWVISIHREFARACARARLFYSTVRYGTLVLLQFRISAGGISTRTYTSTVMFVVLVLVFVR